MHKFNNDWLFLREKIDKVSRNKKIIEKINKYFQDYKILSIADLGCGTGSNYRYLYPKLKKRQSWDMIDISFESIKEFKKKTNNKNKIININYKKFDLIKNINGNFVFDPQNEVTYDIYSYTMGINGGQNNHDWGDYDNDGDQDIIVAVLGDFPPSDKLVGEVVLLTQLSPGKFKRSVLLNNVGRITDVSAVDLDGDKDLDIAVSIFGGGFVGEIAWLENTGNGLHKRHTILKGSGALNVIPADINNDGKIDLVSLIAQEHEVIIAMINKGNGKFQQVRLGQAPHPMFGSTSMKLVDMDNDDDLDLLFTNGDANDLQMDPKPYHGVQWSENKGNLTFIYHDIGRFYGASNAVAGDLDNDGDIDVVASSWHNYWEDPQRQSLIWFENNGKQEFIRHNITNSPRSIVSLELKDITGNNHLDIIAGVFRMDLMIEMVMAAQQKNSNQPSKKTETETDALNVGIAIFENKKT